MSQMPQHCPQMIFKGKQAPDGTNVLACAALRGPLARLVPILKTASTYLRAAFLVLPAKEAQRFPTLTRVEFSYFLEHMHRAS